MKRLASLIFVSLLCGAGFSAFAADGLNGVEANDDEAQSAQTEAPGAVTRSRATLCNAGLALSDEQAIDFVTSCCGASAAEEWSNGVRLYKTGRGLLIGSAVAIPVGALTAVLGGVLTLSGAIAATPGAAAGQSGDNALLHVGNGLFYGGIVVAAAGVPTLIAGSICLPKGKRRMNDVVDRCNGAASEAVALGFGAAPHGVGLTLNF